MTGILRERAFTGTRRPTGHAAKQPSKPLTRLLTMGRVHRSFRAHSEAARGTSQPKAAHATIESLIDRRGVEARSANVPTSPHAKARSRRITFGVTCRDRSRVIKRWRGFARDVQVTPAHQTKGSLRVGWRQAHMVSQEAGRLAGSRRDAVWTRRPRCESASGRSWCHRWIS